MKYRTTKRVKLIICIMALLLSFFLIVFFIHNPIFNMFLKSKAQDIPDFYRKELLKVIAEHPEMTETVREELWGFGITEQSNEKDIMYKPNKTIGVTQYIIDISDYVKISYLIVGFLIMCVSVSLTKWYMSEDSNLFISDRKISIEEILEKHKNKK